MTRSTEKLMNASLHRTIVEELEREPALDIGRVGIAVQDGVVTLTGALPSFSEKLAVEKAVRRVRGVRAVACELNVE
jgi:osmotically-inducible protein OsmY